MDCRSLQTLQGNFNRISSLWLATAEGGFVSRATPQATDYHNALSEHLQAGLRSSLTDLVDYASGRRDWVAMPAMSIIRAATSSTAPCGPSNRIDALPRSE